jgi:hypothetical protein
MATINPINLTKWLPNTPILSNEARAEFMNIYDLVNGNIDAENIADSSITKNKLANGAVTGDKLGEVPANKITGQLSQDNLPSSVFNSMGGTVTGSITFDVPQSTALLKNYDDEEVVIYEGGTGANKIQVFVGGPDIFRIVRGGVAVFSVDSDAVTIPQQLKVPVV